jgi:hypothetical protein
MLGAVKSRSERAMTRGAATNERTRAATRRALPSFASAWSIHVGPASSPSVMRRCAVST